MTNLIAALRSALDNAELRTFRSCLFFELAMHSKVFAMWTVFRSERTGFRIGCLTALLCICLTPALRAQTDIGILFSDADVRSEILIQEDFSKLQLGPQFQIHRGHIPTDSIIPAADDFLWTHYGFSSLRTRFDPTELWARVPVQNLGAETRGFVLELSNPYLPEAQCWINYSDSSKQFPAAGARFPFDDREEDYAQLQYPFELAAGQRAEIFLRLKGDGANRILNITLWDAQARKKEERTRLSLYSVFFGIMITILVLGTIILILIPMDFRLYYLAYTAFGSLMIAAYTGLAFRLIWPNVPYLQQVSGPFLANSTFLFGLIFVQRLFRTRQFYTIINRGLDLLAAGLTLAIIFSWIVPLLGWRAAAYYQIANNAWFLLASIVLVICPLAFWFRDRLPDAAQFFIAIFVHALSLIPETLENMDIVLFAGGTNRLLGLGIINANLMVALVILYRLRNKVREGFQLAQEISTVKRLNMGALLKREEDVRSSVGGEIERRISSLLEDIEGQLKSIPIEQSNSLEQIQLSVEAAKGEIRGIYENRIPGPLVDLGLEAALDEIIRPLEDAGIQVEKNYSDGDLAELDLLYQLAVFRMAQGLLNNTYKHAQASQASISIEIHNEELQMQVSDDGVGFEERPESGGRGLGIIRHRVQSLDGEFNMHSELGRGSAFSIQLPIKAY